MAHFHVKSPDGTAYSIDLDVINTNRGSIPDSGNNGWSVLTNGVIIQWGDTTGAAIVSGSQYANIVLPNMYEHAIFCVLATRIAASDASTWVRTGHITTNGFHTLKEGYWMSLGY